MHAVSFNQSRPPPRTGCIQTPHPAGSYDCCIWQVGTIIEVTHWPTDLQGGTPSPARPGGGESGGGENLLSTFLF